MSSLEVARAQDERGYQITMEQVAAANCSAMHTRYLGTIVALAGIGASAYLASIGQTTAATAIGTLVGTLVAVIIGKKVL